MAWTFAAQMKPTEYHWTYWSIFLCGYDGSFVNVATRNLTSVAIAICSLLASIATLFATQTLTTALSILHVPIWHVLLLIIVVMSSDMSQLLHIIFRSRVQNDKNRMFSKIMTTLAEHIRTAPMEVHRKYNAADYYDATQRVIWVYDRTSKLIITTVVSVARSIAILVFVMWNNIELFPILVISYFIALRFVVPMLYGSEKQKNNSEKLWSRAYFAANCDYNMILNPCTLIKCTSGVVDKFIDIFTYFGDREKKWDISHYVLSLFQNITVLLIVIILYYNSNYAMILIVLLNRDSFFSVVTAYSDMVDTGKRAERSLEKIIGILTTIDEARTKYGALSQSKKYDKIKYIDINAMTIDLVPEKTTKLDEECGDVKHTRTIMLRGLHVSFDNSLYFILLLASSGSGKSALISRLAGRYSLSCCDMIVTYDNGTAEFREFSDLLYYRHEIRQQTADEHKHNGKLRTSLRDLIPFENISIQDVRELLIDHLNINRNVVPMSMTDPIDLSLSPGELQRFIVASELLRALITKPSYLILDEIDKDLDPTSRIHMMNWIIMHFSCPIFIVSHSTEVKMFLLKKRLIRYALTYHQNPINPFVTNIHIEEPNEELLSVRFYDEIV